MTAVNQATFQFDQVAVILMGQGEVTITYKRRAGPREGWGRVETVPLDAAVVHWWRLPKGAELESIEFPPFVDEVGFIRDRVERLAGGVWLDGELTVFEGYGKVWPA